MRLHRLTITAFGPFAGREQVDIDTLASCGLFLIHGPTGAGKTSILDAICFALYAAVPGARTGARANLRSDHAAEGVIPEVTLEFTASGHRLRVTRCPEFSRAKKRGTGRTTVPAKVVLWELEGTLWKTRGTRNDEVALILAEILGMGLEQFIKVVLLPQGDFAAFLRASPEQRRSVLEKLFDTQRFTDIETWLAERRRSTTAAAGNAHDTLMTTLVRVDDVLARLDEGDDIIAADWSGLTHPDDTGGGVDPLAHIDAVLGELAAAVDARASAALAGVDLAASAMAQSESLVRAGTAVVRHQETAAQASSLLDVLDQQRAAYLDAAARLDLGERAGAVGGFLAAVDSASLARDAAVGQVEAMRQPLTPILSRGPDGNQGHPGGVRCLIETLGAHSDGLQHAASHDSHQRELIADSARHTQAARLADARSTALEQQRRGSQEHLAAAQKSAAEGQAALAGIPALQARHRTLGRIRKLLDEQSRSAKDLDRLQRQADQGHTALLNLREALLDLRERRLEGMAAELATGLGAGEPCPVCGSCAHPAKAKTTDVVSSADIRSAEADLSRANETFTLIKAKTSGELARRDGRAVELAAHLEGLPEGATMSQAQVVEALACTEGAIAVAQAAASALPDAQAQLGALALDLERLQELVQEAVSAQASSLALAASTCAQSEAAGDQRARLLAAHDALCPCHDGAPGEVAHVISRHHLSLQQLRALATALGELATQEANFNDAVFRQSAALVTNRLRNVQQAREGALSAAEVGRLTALVRSDEQRRAQATALLAQPDVVAALQLPAPDMDALTKTHRQATASLTEAGRLHTLSEQAQRELHALSRTVHQALADLGPARAQAQLVQELADCFAGNSADNALRMRLSSYVLAARLAEIATLANERLTTMSDGRYTLEYTDARAAKGARSGLGLLVRDAWTGQTRETSSLSGGESFMASLALALGMGDAVRAEAGGFDLQTLFVDEGFGSLDEESLEQVMAVLDTLREGGRAVGIVSHVTELRTRIPHQLEVLKAQGGSRIRAVAQNRESPAA
jgi:exonuclease SbcC